MGLDPMGERRGEDLQEEERGPFGADEEPRKHWGLSPAEASVAPPGPLGAGGSPLVAPSAGAGPLPRPRSAAGERAISCNPGPFPPSPPTIPGSSGHQLTPDLVFRRLFLVQANCFHLMQVTFGGCPPQGVHLSGVTDGVALSVGSTMEMPATRCHLS